MNVKATTDTENKPKATVKNFQFVENLDKLIDIAEKAEENDEVQEGNRRSSYDLVMIRSRYIDRYDLYVMRDGVEGVINDTGTFMTLEESLDYVGYLVGEYKPELFFKD